MERAAFLIDATGEQISCLLNPNELVFRRAAGLSARRSLGAAISGAPSGDDLLLSTGGGTTELTLNLLFDVSLAGSTIPTEDVRDLTGPLSKLAENTSFERGQSRPPLVRFVWGKAWNFPGVVASVAERLEDFLATGVPRRSWMRLRLLRAAEEAPATTSTSSAGAAKPMVDYTNLPVDLTDTEASEEAVAAHVVLGDGPDAAGGQRLDQIAAELLGDASLWRLLAAINGIDNPLRVAAGTVLRLPPRSTQGSVKQP